jgi:hypothetical protein
MSEKHIPQESPSLDYKPRTLDSPTLSEDEKRDTYSVPILTDQSALPSKVLDNINSAKHVEIPFKYRWTAFAFILVYSTGAAFAESVLGPLKSTLLKELQINSKSIQIEDVSNADGSDAQFSTISTATNIVNTMLPTIGGIAMDYVGAVQ